MMYTINVVKTTFKRIKRPPTDELPNFQEDNLSLIRLIVRFQTDYLRGLSPIGIPNIKLVSFNQELSTLISINKCLCKFTFNLEMSSKSKRAVFI